MITIFTDLIITSLTPYYHVYIFYLPHIKNTNYMTLTQKYSKGFYYVVCFKNKSVLAILQKLGYVYDPIVSYSPLSNMACINPSIFLRNTRINSLGVTSNGTVSSPTVDFMDISMLFSMKGI